jgi:hypothetical protein
MIREYLRQKRWERFMRWFDIDFLLDRFLAVLLHFVFVLLFIGTPTIVYLGIQAEKAKPILTYNIALVKPDGEVYRTYQVQSRNIPEVEADEGVSFLKTYPKGLGSNKEHIPNGWRVEISPPNIEL